ncbi:hypothetical protein N7478_000834 [Penicillium angulare]|uniref:uncharacterized protein n=1 Tax=Penicillium angulare TaxID=116970 RepID=UPI0025401C94|nr:uncharacterized protein N7478_000834 [Penicillium angulare]KAJ5291583.1 hypothetical protein N7478_000834 [Penicillium angulare]
MPRKAKGSRVKKQTRLAFNPAATEPTTNGSGDDGERYRTLGYGHPSLASVRTEKSRPGKLSVEIRSSKRSKKESSPDDISSSLKQNTLEPTPQTQSDTSDDEIVPPSSQKRKRQTPIMSPPNAERPSTRRKARRREPSPVESDEQTEVTPRPRRNLKRKAESPQVISLDSEDSEEDPVLSSAVKRRRVVVGSESLKTPRAGAGQDELDIEEDVRDLQDSVVKNTRTRGRLPGSARDKRFKTLEAMRRKRLGLKPESEEEEGEEEEQEQDEIGGGSGQEDEDESPSKQGFHWQVDEGESEEEQVNPSNEDLDRYEDDFVLDDDNVPLGVPAEIPFEFTRHAYKKPKDYFRDVVGWMVHNRLDPAFPRTDPMYEMAFMKLEDEVKGRAGSQLISSVWNRDFHYALLARPHMEITSYPTIDCHSCDACNRSGHPASSDMKLYGKPYSLQTLEPLCDSEEDQSRQTSTWDEDESNETDAGVERDRDGHALPDEHKRFLLGRQCKHKAQLAHTLTHWRFHLYEWVVGYLERKGHMADDEILRRSNMSQKRKTRNAIKVLESMIEAGEVEKLWRDFHTNLKTARGERYVFVPFCY